jgi:hypothetical protein
VVAVAPYPDAVGWLAVPGAYPVDGWGGCLVFVALGVARGIGRVYSSRMGTNNTFATGQTVTGRAWLATTTTLWSVLTVVSRTAKFVKLEDSDGVVRRVGVKLDYNGNEFAMPDGRRTQWRLSSGRKVATGRCPAFP